MENVLKSLIVLNGKSIPEVANMMNLSKSSLYRKIRGKSEFTRKEITELIDILHIEPYKAMEIFFNIKVS
ncbi:XRE family transcriptional regulator [Clostridium perfringens]|uniref:helix-turn-helix domain-containing protein n=1 Tax=Clostridium perfringens TaxID=1502 RepID=UPI0013E3F77B|nr:helix-turn-helix transcriptional regulator [Clostridium perfringens]MDU2442885.1 helix-turn-helix transcriptional regulator [Clostridium perfringens]NGT54999.1 helix-turn-helix transcriptional regulator [Clostridium perfringens]